MEAIVQSKSLVEQAYDALLDAICTGSLKPGDRVAQDEIAEKLNVSRQPVNSAIAMLKAQRFVKDTGRRGVVVAPVDKHLFLSIYQFRSAVEPLAVELAARRLDADAIRQGRNAVARGYECVQAGDARGVLLADIEFHTLIYRLSGNPIVADTMRLNWQHLRRSMGEVLRSPGMSAQVWKEHKSIFETMVKGETAEAASLMRDHITVALERVGGASITPRRPQT